ncbi:uncharacterized protein A1O5_02797 [Cladophialophora psammophila CBS 110553]|uniref:Uncharacterized protein n=1 Tax=Cladophialophora psammophila CBS 110553 TaxID=1182543 RepID=W9XC51_9EURO|nr:uncharacterized protein A1O5_02797 [Cladophialophora psammophila CBS 110553]EXJ74501.1 hypothetical protein A1O5_02797 [Cladophialophora psammophila CBS 110553]
MDSIFSKVKSLRKSSKSKSEPPIAVNTYYEQYRTENMQTVFKDYYPSTDLSREERDLLITKRLEVSKAAERLEVDKKAFTASNHQAAQERVKAGLVGAFCNYGQIATKVDYLTYQIYVNFEPIQTSKKKLSSQDPGPDTSRKKPLWNSSPSSPKICFQPWSGACHTANTEA